MCRYEDIDALLCCKGNSRYSSSAVMGSCSSKSRTKILKVSIGQPINPPEMPTGESIEERSGTYNQGGERELKQPTRSFAKDNLTDRGWHKPKPKDPDLQLLDEILAESEDCLSWQDPTSKTHTSVSRSHNDNSSPKLRFCAERKRQEPSQLQSSSSGFEGSQCRHHPVQENCNRTADMPDLQQTDLNILSDKLVKKRSKKSDVQMGKGVLDFENNNLPYQPQSFCTNTVEKTIAITYDASDEALMDSIEEEYSQQDPLPPVHEATPSCSDDK